MKRTPFAVLINAEPRSALCHFGQCFAFGTVCRLSDLARLTEAASTQALSRGQDSRGKLNSALLPHKIEYRAFAVIVQHSGVDPNMTHQ